MDSRDVLELTQVNNVKLKTDSQGARSICLEKDACQPIGPTGILWDPLA